MATLRAAPTQPGTPWCLKKEGPANKGEMEPPTPTTPSTKHSSCIEKQTHLPNERQLTVRATPKNCSASPEQFGAKLDRNGEGAVDDQRQGHMMSRQLTREARKSFLNPRGRENLPQPIGQDCVRQRLTICKKEQGARGISSYGEVCQQSVNSTEGCPSQTNMDVAALTERICFRRFYPNTEACWRLERIHCDVSH